METLHENIATSHFHPVENISQFTDTRVCDNAQIAFFQQSLLIRNYYRFVENADCNEQKIIGLILFYDLADFLLWVHQPIVDIFGNVEKKLHLFRCWDEKDYHLVLTVHSNLDDMDKLTVLENKLFEKLNHYSEIDQALAHVVIAQR